jgi:exopolysaccharide biosynthesis polyprenyl glycosylphosphotransferase
MLDRHQEARARSRDGGLRRTVDEALVVSGARLQTAHRAPARPGWILAPWVAQRAWWRDALLRRMLALADAAAAATAAGIVGIAPSGGLDTAFWAALAVPVWIVLAKLHGLYDRDQRALRHLTIDELPSIFLWVTTSTAATMLLLAASPVGPISKPTTLAAWAGALTVAAALRALARFVWRRTTPAERTMIVGNSTLAAAARRKIELFRDMHVELVGELESDDLDETLDQLRGIDRVILATGSLDEPLLATLLVRCREEQIKLTVVPPLRGMFGTAVQLNHVADLPLLQYSTWDIPRSTLFLKRTLDIVVSVLLLVLLAPLFAAVAIAIKLDSRGPVFFSQTRAGLGGRPFRMHKFRTMVRQAEELLADLVPFDQLREPVFKLRNDPRTTRVGRVLRRTSLDELPQLVNVLRGEMSLVGPRPEQIELVERYTDEQRFRIAVKPGLSGPMQVFGRGELTLEERLAVEREYIENLSLRRDLRILALTVPAVIGGDGAF